MSLRNGKNFYEINPSKPLTPASTTKLLTAYSALLLFGSDYDIPTAIYAHRKPVKGVVKGNIYIKGHGDPLFSVGDIGQSYPTVKRSWNQTH